MYLAQNVPTFETNYPITILFITILLSRYIHFKNFFS
jgi:hypothetical protein